MKSGAEHYDANGNLTGISTGRTFTWDVFNRMISTTASGRTVTYTYNGDGLKTRRVGPNGTSNYYHDGIRPIWETDSAGAMTAQYDRDIFGTLLSRSEIGSVRRYYHHDGIGSSTALTDSSGTVAATVLYDAWGNARTSTGTSQGNYRFAGTELDTSTGLYHMGARFYDPAIGRWLSEDPVQDRPFEPASLTFYNYASNNPVLRTDPTGTMDGGDGGGQPKSAEERLQDFINALNLLNQWTEYMVSQGRTSLTIGGHQFLLADMLRAANFLASRAADIVYSTTEEVIRAIYEYSGYVGTIGTVLLFIGVAMRKSGSKVLGATLQSAGLALMGVGFAGLGLAYLLDMILTGGSVRRNASPPRQ